MLRTTEMANVYAQLVEQSSRTPHDPRPVLAALAQSGRWIGNACGAIAYYTPPATEAVYAAATSHELQCLAIDTAAWNEGPAFEARSTGRILLDVDITTQPLHVRWPRWAPRALQLSMDRVTALPLTVGADSSCLQNDLSEGALVLFNAAGRPWDRELLTHVPGLVRTAAHLLSLQAQVAEQRVLAGQLQHALDSRVVIEQAKGILAARHDLTLGAAFGRLRTYARSHGLKVAEVARRITEEGADPTLLSKESTPATK
nr:ANTAR domain-containing protein [Streptomyces sp. SID14478]